MNKVVPHKVGPAALASYKAFDEFKGEAELLAEDAGNLKKALKKAEEEAKYAPKAALKTIREGLAGIGCCAGRFPEEMVRRHHEFIERHYEWDDVDENEYEAITRREISKAVALLLGSFPNTSNIPDPKVYTRMMIEEIIAAEPNMLAVESTCREIRRTATFAPAIGEVLTVLRKHDGRWFEWLRAVNEYRPLYKKAAALAASLEQQLNPQVSHKPVAPLVVGVPVPAAVSRKESTDD